MDRVGRLFERGCNFSILDWGGGGRKEKLTSKIKRAKV